MKTGVPSALHVIISNLAIISCFAPILLLASRKIRKVIAYRIIAIYWMLNGFVDLFNLDINPFFENFVLRDKIIFWYNMLDTPLVLLTFATAVTGKHRRTLFWIILAYIASEALILSWKGYAFLVTYMICSAGPVLILVASIAGLIRYVGRVEHSPLENTMAFVYAALLFAYGSFLIIYVFMPTRDNNSNYRDSFLLYYISMILSAGVTMLGLCSYGLHNRSYSSSSS